MIEPRYTVRPSAGMPDRFTVWDTARDAAVFRADLMPEREASGMAHRLNIAYHDFRREPVAPRGWDCVPT